MSLKYSNIVSHMEMGVRKVLKVSHIAKPFDPWSSRRGFKSRLHLKTRSIKTDERKKLIMGHATPNFF